jgi:protein-S-isoprenylcysteine O-methyltransferase Ste14
VRFGWSHFDWVTIGIGEALILQSRWGLAPLPLILIVLILRILNEEEVLRAGLPGYADYCKKVRWRMVPFIW